MIYDNYTETDIVTTEEERSQGFLQQARRHFAQATEFVNQISVAKSLLEESDGTLENLIKIAEKNDLLFNVVINLSGFSTKAVNAIGYDETKRLVRQHLIDIQSLFSTDNLLEAFLFRYALICGDQLGGVMRNTTGKIAQNRLTSIIITKMINNYEKRNWLESGKQKFKYFSKDDTLNILSSDVSSFQWPNRVLVFNMKPKIIDKNIDMILLKTSRWIEQRKQLRTLLEQKDKYIMCGELKGGIDPAGADEHWKTARSAFDRILEKFLQNPPELAFVGAAIENAMAKEIVSRLKNKRLSAVANLCKPEQVNLFVDWMLSL